MKTKLLYFAMMSFMLFSLFFGAGNLIFPPLVGKNSGYHVYLTMITFGITAVVLPVLGVIVTAKYKGLMELATKVHPLFAKVFTVLIFMSIGPFLGIPRAGSTPFEMAIRPYIPSSINPKLALLIYTLVFFAVAYWIASTPNKIVDRIGKVLTPTLLVLLVVLFIGSLVVGLGKMGIPSTAYQKDYFVQGFLDGYNTMDAIAALMFGAVITNLIQSRTHNLKTVRLQTTICGIIAGSLLFIIYMMLAHMGARTGILFPNTKTGADILVSISKHIFGDFGAFLLALIFTLACLTTCVGLLTSISQYFFELTGKFTYKKWLFMWVIISTCLANFGLNAILTYSIPLLTFLYPVAIVLIILGLIDDVFNSNQLVYRISIVVTVLLSLVDTLAQVGFKIPFIYLYIQYLPFSSKGLSFLLPTTMLTIITIIYVKSTKLNFTNQ